LLLALGAAADVSTIASFDDAPGASTGLMRLIYCSRRNRTTGDDRLTTAHDLATALRVAYLALHSRANAEFAQFGLTADQFVLLTALAEDGALMQKGLVRRAGSDPNTMSNMRARLERNGLVERGRTDGDGRAWSVRLTACGREPKR
jgi:DNA-binding MarR family transcriptional regulator